MAPRIVLFFLLLMCSAAYSHGTEQWIADRALGDPVSHQFCCGPTDCQVLDDSQVKEVEGGFQIDMTMAINSYKTTGAVVVQVHEMIPYQRALPFSPDRKYHACFTRSSDTVKVRCFIAPPGDS